MKQEDVEYHIKSNYHTYDVKLNSLIDSLEELLIYYRNERIKLFRNSDFRPGTVGRLISTIITVRFFLNNTKSFIEDDDWTVLFQEKYIPTPFKGNGYFGVFKDIEMQIRFILFHQIYHQFETTLRIICKVKDLGPKKPIDAVNELTKSFPIEFIEYIEAIRNTIHNNGYYQPIGKKQRKEFTYDLDGNHLKFSENNRIELDMDDFIATSKLLIDYIIKMLRHPEIENIETTTDKN